MAPQTFRVDAKASKITLRTRAVGALSRFAHDLEIASIEALGTAAEDSAGWTAELSVPVASLRVLGARKDDRLDEGALSAADRAEIERKMRKEVLSFGPSVLVRARGASRDRGEAVVSIGSSRASIKLSHEVAEGKGAVAVTGRAELSLRALGVAEIKGPLGVFRVADKVEVLYTLALSRG